MRNFFPYILILVAAAMFVLSGAFLYRILPELDLYLFYGEATLGYANELMWHIGSLLAGMMLSVWVANWAWKEIRREKIGRSE